MIYFKISMSDLVIQPSDLELLKPIIERAHAQETKWMGSGKPSVEYVRPATLADVKVTLVDGNAVEVQRMWYNDNILDKV